MQGAIKTAGLWPHCVAMMTGYNVPLTPFGEGRRHREAEAAIADYALHCDPTSDPIYTELFRRILEDRDMVGAAHDANIRQEVWEDVVNHEMWRKGASKVNMTRFMSIVYRAREEDAVWHSRLLGWIYLALQIGLLSSSSLSKNLAAAHAASRAHTSTQPD